MPNILSIIQIRGDTMNESLEHILSFIHQADDAQISEIIQALILRYGQIHPDWDVSFLSLPKNDPIQRQQMLRSILQLHEQI